MDETFKSFIQNPKISRLLERLPHKDAVFKQTRSAFIGSFLIHTTLVRIGWTKKGERTVEVYACMMKVQKSGNSLPEVSYHIVGNDGYLSNRIAKDAILDNPDFTFDTIFGSSKPSKSRLAYFPKYYLLHHSFQNGGEIPASTKVTQGFMREMISYCKELPPNKPVVHSETPTCSHTSPPQDEFLHENTASHSVAGIMKRQCPSQVTGSHTAINQANHSCPGNTTNGSIPVFNMASLIPEERVSPHSSHSTQTTDSHNTPLLQVLTSKIDILDRIKAAELREEELRKKMEAIKDELDVVVTEHAEDVEAYNKNKEEEQKTYSAMTEQERTIFKMIEKARVLESEREEKRRKGGL